MADKNVIRQDVVQISFDVLDNPMKEVQDMVNGLASEANKATKSVDDITEAAKKTAGSMSEIVNEAKEATSSVNDVAAGAKETVKNAKEAEVRFSAMAKALAGSVVAKIKSLPKAVQSSATAAREFAASLKAKVFDSAISRANKLKDTILSVKKIKLSNITSGLDKSLGKAVQNARNIPKSLKVSAISGFSKTVEGLKSKFEDVRRSSKKLPEDIEEAKRATSELNGSFTILKGTIANLASNALSNVIGSVKSLAGEAISASDSMAKFEQTMGFAGYDDKIIKETSKNVKEYADLTVYELDTIANTTAQLAANGIKDFNGLTQAAGNLNAVAGGNADTFNSVAMVLTQTAGAGKLTTENWNQLANAIPGASGRLIEAMKEAGAYTGDFRDAMAKGEISADEFNAALMALGNEPIAVEAATSVSTFEGAMGNLQATVVSGMMDIYDTIGRKNIANAITKVSGAISKAIPPIKNAVSWFIQNVPKVASVVKEKISPITDVIKDVKTAIFDMATSQSAIDTVMWAFEKVEGVVDPIIGIVHGIVEEIKSFATAESTVSTLEGAFNGIKTVLGGIFDAASTALNFIKENLDLILPLVEGVVIAWGAYKAIILVTNGVIKAYTAIQWAANAAMNANPIGLIITAIGLLIGAIILLIRNWDKVKQKASEVWNSIKGVWNPVKNWFMQHVVNPVKKAFSGLWESVKSIFSTVGSFFSGVWSTITGIFSGVGSWFSEKFSEAYSALTGAFSNVKVFFSGLWGDIKGIFTDIGVKIGDAVGGAFTAVINGVLEIIEGTINNAIGLINKAIGFINKALPKKHEIGTVGDVSLPRLAKGGIIEQPTIAQIGEAGKEAVLPLENNTGWIKKIAKELAGLSGGNYGGQFKGGDSTTTTYKEYNEYNDYSPHFTLNLNGASATEDNKRKVKQWVKEAMTEMFDELDRDNPPAWEV